MAVDASGGYSTRVLTTQIWVDFAAMVEANKGVWGRGAGPVPLPGWRSRCATACGPTG
jgi:hypothetical protein